MFPTSKDIEFFKEAKRIQELWEPKFGDRVRLAPHDLYHFEDGIIVLGREDGAEDIVVVRTDDVQHLLLYTSELIWLPRQGQLQEMLEERGYAWKLDVNSVREKGHYGVTLWCIAKSKYYIREDYTRHWYGPTPSIALGKCLLEVLDD